MWLSEDAAQHAAPGAVTTLPGLLQLCAILRGCLGHHLLGLCNSRLPSLGSEPVEINLIARHCMQPRNCRARQLQDTRHG